MKQINGIILLLFILISGCRKDVPESEAHAISTDKEKTDTVTVSFYNVENLFDLNFDGLEYPEYKPGTSNWDQEIQRKKVENTASVISAIDADVVALCEVENGNALKQLKNALSRRGKNYPFMVIGEGPEKTITCTAILSKYRLVKYELIPVDLGGKAKTRCILEADLQIGKSSLKLFVNHWPSKSYPESFRIKAGETLRSRLLNLQEGTDYVLLGDFNCDYDEYLKLKVFGHDDADGRTSINHVLNTVRDGNHFVRERDFTGGIPGMHYDLWLELPETERMSYVFRGNNQTPDHIILPASLYDSRGFSYIDNSFRVFTWEGQLIRNGKPFRWQTRWKKKRKMHTGEGYSDHLPVCASFVNKPFQLDTLSEASQDRISGADAIDSGGFESSSEGWVSCNSGVSLFRDTVSVKHGKFCLRISGDARKANSSASKAILRKNSAEKTIKFNLRGNGKVSFRIRKAGGDWVYYNPPSFKPSSSARYSEVRFDSWKEVALEVTDQGAKEVELETRVGKDSPFCFWVDNVEW